MACSEAEGECKGHIQGSPPLLSLLQHTPRETPNQMPAPQDEKIGLSYRKTGGYVSVFCLCPEVEASQELFLQLLQSLGTQELQPHWPPEPGDQGVSPWLAATKTRAP